MFRAVGITLMVRDIIRRLWASCVRLWQSSLLPGRHGCCGRPADGFRSVSRITRECEDADQGHFRPAGTSRLRCSCAALCEAEADADRVLGNDSEIPSECIGQIGDGYAVVMGEADRPVLVVGELPQQGMTQAE